MNDLCFHFGYALLALSLWLLARGNRQRGLSVQFAAQFWFVLLGAALEIHAMTIWSTGFMWLAYFQLTRFDGPE